VTAAGRPLFPLIRHLSVRVTPWLLRLPVSANQVTAAALVAGLAAAWTMAQGSWPAGLAGSALLVACYVLDNCDGEVARQKNQCSRFGMYFDSFVDWVVHSAVFAALGYGWARATGEAVWLWLGLIAAGGGTFNYFLGYLVEAWDRRHGGASVREASPEQTARPCGAIEWALFAFRELSRADFCFLVLGLAAFDLAWLLLPAGAIGAQVYWATQFVRRARQFHV
jgi:phosphatidylglycerophosphate synthase